MSASLGVASRIQAEIDVAWCRRWSGREFAKTQSLCRPCDVLSLWGAWSPVEEERKAGWGNPLLWLPCSWSRLPLRCLASQERRRGNFAYFSFRGKDMYWYAQNLRDTSISCLGADDEKVLNMEETIPVIKIIPHSNQRAVTFCRIFCRWCFLMFLA